MEDKKVPSLLAILSTTCIALLEGIILILDAFDDGLSDTTYFDEIGNDFERDLKGKLRNKITERPHSDNHYW
ncbi:hypothetical protein RG677_003679 [Vibrio parahaemolyticus]|uniref:hypothetical protein n=1 Tax=Vibrio parahaemolyticus TaxID=670 RepID=UPI00046E8B19|nr:hypothetical protein [Vibrio parahaemolyticus]EHK0752015.1 hypothetical protein [Vibrio parahaemolyticus]EJB8573620.1 hypothetical protein [Vibrio parahaemolyticus]EJE4176447.1 hypothetical protein [Vibrio parahaemolyticus]ELB2952193.1 hypothetical protein [Vibrio parahaemolyticus]MCR9781349.1 hypothetical protein [Vibrio parahaemolyticus]